MTAISAAKVTYDQYGRAYQLHQADKYRNREKNTQKLRINLAQHLVKTYALPRLSQKETKDIVVTDVGCSIGTFALEFSRLGYRSYGIDYDPHALSIARELCTEENLKAEFINMDLADWAVSDLPRIDIAICFDIFEHLHDDELGSFLQAVRKQLSDNGSLVFHTYPTEFDYIFFKSWIRILPLLPFKQLSPKTFTRILRSYASMLDILLMITRGVTVREYKKNQRHCNPTTIERLSDVLHRAGFDILCMETMQLYTEFGAVQRSFYRQPISHRNLFGVAVPKTQR